MDFTLLLLLPLSLALTPDQDETPKFTEGISNVTVVVGREAIFTCVVKVLYNYKVAWLKVDTQTILTIQSHVVTKNHRISVTHSDRHTWQLHIKEVREADKGWYMCQTNAEPTKSKVGYLDVVVPPDILDYPTSTDMMVREGQNVTLKCIASGTPTPSVIWRREEGVAIPLENGTEVSSVNGPMLNITKVNRLHMGAYLCIASNGIPPTVSKRMTLTVHFPPMITVQNQLVGAIVGQSITLECSSEAYPKSINYWTKDNGDIITEGEKYQPEVVEFQYRGHMKLTVRDVSKADFSTYKCVSKNSLGETDGTIRIYHIPTPTTVSSTQATTPNKKSLTTTQTKLGVFEHVQIPQKTEVPRVNHESNDIRLFAQENNLKSEEATRRSHQESHQFPEEGDKSRISLRSPNYLIILFHLTSVVIIFL